MMGLGADLAKTSVVLALTNLKASIMGYEGHISLIEDFEKSLTNRLPEAIETKESLEDLGMSVEMVSMGTTGTFNFVGEFSTTKDG